MARYRTGADRRRPFRAMDEGEDPVEFIRELIGELDPEELERLGSGDRRPDHRCVRAESLHVGHRLDADGRHADL